MNWEITEITDNNGKQALLLSPTGVDTFATICKFTAPEMLTAISFSELVKLLKGNFITAPSYHRALCGCLQKKNKSNETVKEY